MQDVSGVYTSPFHDTDGLKIALRVETFPVFREKGPWPGCHVIAKLIFIVFNKRAVIPAN